MDDTRYAAWSIQTATASQPYRGQVPTNPRGEAFGALIRSARQRKGLTQDDVVEESGVSRSTLTRWERGDATNPKPDELRAVCRVLDVNPLNAAVALGYLAADDLTPADNPATDPTVEEVLAILRDPTIPAEAIQQWIGVLKHLRQRPPPARRKGA